MSDFIDLWEYEGFELYWNKKHKALILDGVVAGAKVELNEEARLSLIRALQSRGAPGDG